jgi:hypothetical protein
MRQITTDIKPWFKSHKLYYRENSDTQVHYLFLVRGEDTAHLPQGVYLPLDNAVIRKIIKGLDAEAPRTALFSDLFGEMPTLEGMVSELALLTSGFKTKKNPVDDRK